MFTDIYGQADILARAVYYSFWRKYILKTYIDLHMHSTASDGTLSPAQIVASAMAEAGNKKEPVVIALTDHDTVAGIPGIYERSGKI